MEKKEQAVWVVNIGTSGEEEEFLNSSSVTGVYSTLAKAFVVAYRYASTHRDLVVYADCNIVYSLKDFEEAIKKEKGDGDICSFYNIESEKLGNGKSYWATIERFYVDDVEDAEFIDQQ